MVIDVSRINRYEEVVRKARLISIKENKILICNYNGHYMLPGGKIDQNESGYETIKREIEEELGHQLKSVTECVTINNYTENYLSRNSNIPRNRKIVTTYYTTDDDINLTGTPHLSEKEKDGYFEIFYADIAELKEKLNNAKLNHKQNIFAKEVLAVINYYLGSDKLIDLHTHTSRSDGEYTPNELVEKAINENLNTIAITDHDTIAGLNELNMNDPRITIIPGIEITVKVPKGRMHILGLGIDYTNKDLLDYLKEMREFNRHNILNIVNYLTEIGIHLDQDEIKALMKKDKNIGRPDIAHLLIKEGYVKKFQEAFDKYLIEAFVKTRHLNKGHTYKDALEVIELAHGISVLAHPNSLELNHEEFEELIKDMKDKKLKGLEVYHSHMSEEEREYYMGIADYYNLLYSGGTDFHGEHVKEEISLGTGRKNIYLTELPIMRVLENRTYQQ